MTGIKKDARGVLVEPRTDRIRRS